jgi:hypothetical protein
MTDSANEFRYTCYDTTPEEVYAKMWKAAPGSEQTPIEPNLFSADDGESWVECPSDWDCFDAWDTDAIVVGAEYDLDVCWTGKQTYRIKSLDSDGNVDEVELVSTDKQFFNGPQPKRTPLSATEIERLISHENGLNMFDLVRIIEQAHGIGE